jgi:hypothetical protein
MPLLSWNVGMTTVISLSKAGSINVDICVCVQSICITVQNKRCWKFSSPFNPLQESKIISTYYHEQNTHNTYYSEQNIMNVQTTLLLTILASTR